MRVGAGSLQQKVGALVAAGSASLALSLVVIPGGAARASPTPPSTSNCTYTSSLSSGTAAVVVTPGANVSISCSGMPANTAVAVAESSPLAQLLPTSQAEAEADVARVLLGHSTDASGDLNVTFTMPTAFSASDPNAACPPTQAQMNAGLVDCELVIAELTSTALNMVQTVYQGQTSPTPPTLGVSDSAAVAGDGLQVSGTGWWGNAVGGAPDAGRGVTLSTTVGGVSAANTLAVSSATYSGGVLTAPKLSGTVTVPAGGSNGGVVVQETNTTTATGNGDLNPTLGTNNVKGTAPFSYEGAPSATASPATAGLGTTVSVSGAGFDPQGGTPTVSFSAGSPASTGTATVNAAGQVAGSIVVTSGDTPGSNDIVITQSDKAGGSLTATATFTVSSLAAGPAPKVNQIISEQITGNPSGLTLADPSGGVPTEQLSGTTLNGYAQTATGAISQVTVIDSRGTLAGWSVTGQLERDFNGGTAGANAIDKEIPASDLTIAPRIVGAPNGGRTGEVVAANGGNPEALDAAAADLGDAGSPVPLASAAAGGGGGAYLLNGALSLTVPGYVSQGTYTATLDLVIS